MAEVGQDSYRETSEGQADAEETQRGSEPTLIQEAACVRTAQVSQLLLSNDLMDAH